MSDPDPVPPPPSPRGQGLLLAISMFTVAPLPARTTGGRVPTDGPVSPLRWLPLVGALIGGSAGLGAALVMLRSPGSPLLAAVVGVLLLIGLSGGLHMDGLADTTDGLASRAPAAGALEIMRRSDIGPFGVLALVAALLVDVVALSAVLAGETAWRAPVALGVAAMTARLTAVHAARPAVAAARVGGFGSLVTGTAPAAVGWALTVVILAVGAGAAALVDASVPGWVLSQGGALVVAALLQRAIVKRLGGMTGDVFGALIEVCTAATLVGFALS